MSVRSEGEEILASDIPTLSGAEMDREAATVEGYEIDDSEFPKHPHLYYWRMMEPGKIAWALCDYAAKRYSPSTDANQAFRLAEQVEKALGSRYQLMMSHGLVGWFATFAVLDAKDRHAGLKDIHGCGETPQESLTNVALLGARSCGLTEGG